MHDNIAAAEDYYRGFLEHDLESIANHLHPEVRLIGPMGELKGKEAVLAAAARLVRIIKGLTFRARFAEGDQIMLVYDMTYGEPIGICPTAVLMNFKDGLIIRSELFYDARPFGNL